MLARLSAAIAAICLLSSAAFSQAASKPTDPQIAHIAYTAGVIDITAAEQAISKFKNKDVLAFANDMVRDHDAVNMSRSSGYLCAVEHAQAHALARYLPIAKRRATMSREDESRS